MNEGPGLSDGLGLSDLASSECPGLSDPYSSGSVALVLTVTEFSKKTGDYPSLSPTDIKVLALTYQLELEHVGSDHLRKEPDLQVRVPVVAPTGVSVGVLLSALVLSVLGQCLQHAAPPRGSSEHSRVPPALKGKVGRPRGQVDRTFANIYSLCLYLFRSV